MNEPCQFVMFPFRFVSVPLNSGHTENLAWESYLLKFTREVIFVLSLSALKMCDDHDRFTVMVVPVQEPKIVHSLHFSSIDEDRGVFINKYMLYIITICYLLQPHLHPSLKVNNKPRSETSSLHSLHLLLL